MPLISPNGDTLPGSNPKYLIILSGEANDVNYHLIMNHSMLEDTIVFAATGISALLLITTRMAFALLLVWGRKIVRLQTVSRA